MRLLVFALVLFCSGIAYSQDTNQPKLTIEKNGSFTNVNVSGSLASKIDIGCIPMDEVTNQLTPPDLYKGVAACIDADEYEYATDLFALAGMYGSFDAERVTDKTAGQARSVLIMRTFTALPEDKKQRFKKTLEGVAKNEAELEATCARISNIGYPDYYPEYMILHGMKAFTGNPHENALVAGFAPEATWKRLMRDYLHCP